jgi:hypothetical protein
MKVNEVGAGEVRTGKAVKKKWQDMSSGTKKKEAKRRYEMKATGGGQYVDSVLSVAEQKVVEIITTEAIDGVLGGLDIGIVNVEDVGLEHELKGEEVRVDGEHDAGLNFEGTVDGVVNSVRKRGAKGGSDWEREKLMELEEKRLKVDCERLEVEKRRLVVEEKRLELEQQRFDLELQKQSMFDIAI